MDIAIILNSPYKIKNVKQDNIIYTDGGYKNKKYNKGKTTLAVVGDFDTLNKIPKSEKIIKLEREKNFTDGERAVHYASELQAKNIFIYGATGGRLEHILGNITLLKIAKNLSINARLVGENCEIVLLNESGEFKAKKGTTISIIPYTDECKFKTSKGLYYPLNNLTLTKADTIGISNFTNSETFSLEIEKGEALVIIDRKK